MKNTRLNLGRYSFHSAKIIGRPSWLLVGQWVHCTWFKELKIIPGIVSGSHRPGAVYSLAAPKLTLPTYECIAHGSVN